MSKLFNKLSVAAGRVLLMCGQTLSFVISLVVITLFSVGFYFYRNFLDASYIKTKAEELFYADTGKKLNAEHAEMVYSMLPALKLKNVEITDDQTGNVLAVAEESEISWKILSLFTKKAVFNVRNHNIELNLKNKKLFFPKSDFLLKFDYGSGKDIVFSSEIVADFLVDIGKSKITGKILADDKNVGIKAQSDFLDLRDFVAGDASEKADDFPFLTGVALSADIAIPNGFFNGFTANTPDDSVKKNSGNQSFAQDKLFSDEPLENYFLREYKTNTDIKIKQVVYSKSKNLEWDDIAINYANDGKKEKLRAESLSPGKKLNVNIDRDNNSTWFSADMSLKGASYEDGNDYIKNADVLLTAMGKSKGDTMAKLAANMNGHFFLNVSNAETSIKIPDIKKVLAKTVKSGSNNNNHISCMIVDADFVNGRADIANHAALESDDFNAVFDGYIDLKNERLDIGMLPSSKNTLSGKGSDVVMSLFRLKGSFLNPEIKSGKSVSDFLKVMSDKGKGLVSFISGDILSVNEKHPCRKILEDIKKKKDADSINDGTGEKPRMRRLHKSN